MLLVGTVGNPLVTLCEQVGCRLLAACRDGLLIAC